MVEDILIKKYSLTPLRVYEVTGGCSAKAYRAETEQGIYFVKEYDKSQPTMVPFIKRIDAYMPALAYLSGLPALAGRVVRPVAAKNGAYKIETESNVYVLFEFTEGETPGIDALTRVQKIELAEILALLHDTVIPFETPGLIEDNSMPFCEQLEQYLTDTPVEHDALSRLLIPHTEQLLGDIREVISLRDNLRMKADTLLLCHGDAHGFNVIQSKRLVLADWEDLRLAPAEADLFMYANDPDWDAFLQAYTTARPGFCLNNEMLRFYVSRRRLDDIWFDVQRITQEDPGEREVEKMMGWLVLQLDC